MRSAAWFTIEVIAAAALTGYICAEGWSWWLLLAIYPLSVIGLAHLISTDGDAHERPIAGFTLDRLGSKALDVLIAARRQEAR